MTRCAFIGSTLPTRRHYFRFVRDSGTIDGVLSRHVGSTRQPPLPLGQSPSLIGMSLIQLRLPFSDIFFQVLARLWYKSFR
jgi:hypothetical protein